jgi:hypothetical protein
MKHTFLLFFIMGSTINGFSGTTDTILANDPAIEFSGRIDFTNNHTPRFSYSGVSVRFSTSSLSVKAILNDEKGENYFALIIDENYCGKIKTLKGLNQYELNTLNVQGAHEYELVKITEEMFGKVSFEGVLLDQGSELVKNQPERSRTIEFIGNSITCGYGNEGKLGEIFSASTENHYMTYAAITVRSFAAKPLMVCKSGIGIYRNYDGPKTGNEDCMPNYYDRIFLYDQLPKYNFGIQPDLVCINLGTNDFSTNGVDTSVFIHSYLKFIEQIADNYQQPEIICIVGPMLENETLTLARQCIKQVVEKSNKTGKATVHLFEMSHQTGDLGIDYHPTIEQNIKNSIELSNFINQLKGWEIKQRLIYAKASSPNRIVVYANSSDLINNINSEQLTISTGNQKLMVENLLKDGENARIEIVLSKSLKAGQKIRLDFVINNLRANTLFVEY